MYQIRFSIGSFPFVGVVASDSAADEFIKACCDSVGIYPANIRYLFIPYRSSGKSLNNSLALNLVAVRSGDDYISSTISC